MTTIDKVKHHQAVAKDILKTGVNMNNRQYTYPQAQRAIECERKKLKNKEYIIP